jgi:hypothetical protein
VLRKGFKVLGIVTGITYALTVLASLVFVLGLTPLKGYAVDESSMGKTIPNGSFVLDDRGHFQVGKPVKLEVEDKVVTHRLVGLVQDGPQKGMTITKGDANAAPDNWHVPVSQIEGGVVFHVPVLGWMYWTLPGRLVLSAVGLILFYWNFRSPRKPAATPELDPELEPASVSTT